MEKNSAPLLLCIHKQFTGKRCKMWNAIPGQRYLWV